MQITATEISVKGISVRIPSLKIGRETILLTGKFLKTAKIHDEEWTEEVANPEVLIEQLKKAPLKADIFTFSQPVSDAAQKFSYPLEWDDVAAVPITTFSEWWEGLPQEARKNVRRAERRGVTVKQVAYDDKLVAGIKSMYDETPIRQGRHFWHYGKDFETVKLENGTFLEHSDFVAAYFNEELIGFIKMVYVGKTARIMQILSKNAHFDKRPPNALLAKAMEICCQKGMTHFIYGKYFYGNKGDTPITEFKRRNGFQRVMIPRYFVPLTFKGRVAIALKLHRGVKNLIPRRIINFLIDLRARLNTRTQSEEIKKTENSPDASKMAEETTIQK